ncbi:MAG: diguanylate cyclase [Angelakisella sp.]
MKTKWNSGKRLLLNGLVILGAVVLVSVMVKGYLLAVRNTEQSRVDQVVRESAVQSVALINERMNNDMEYIRADADYIARQKDAVNSARILLHIHERNDANDVFKDINIITPDGNLYCWDGSVLGNVSERSYFKEAMQGSNVVSNIEKSLDGKDIITIAAPIVRGGQVIGVVNGRFLMSALKEFLSAEFFGGRGYSYMANSDGGVFVRSNHPSADPNFTSIYHGFKPIPSVSDAALQEMLQQMADGKEGQIFYEWHGEKRTMSYMPVGINDWYLLSVLPNEIVASRAMEVTQQVFLLTGALMIVLALLVYYVYRQRRSNQLSLASMHHELLTIYNTIPGGVFKCLIDDGFTVTEANDGFFKFFGYTKEQFRQQYQNQMAQIMRPDDVARVRMSVTKQLYAGKTVSDEVQMAGADGTIRWLLINGEIVHQEIGEDLIYCCFTDISALKRTQKKLKESEERYALIMAETQNIVFEWNPVDNTIVHSKMYQKKFGVAPITTDFPKSVLDGRVIHEEDEKTFLNIYRRIERGDHFSTDEIRIQKADGSFLWCRVSATAVRDSQNKLIRVVGIIEDIDDTKRELQELTEIAQHDALTNLYNKMTTTCLVEKRLLTAAGAVLLVVDIDDFKHINDTLGHAMGDAALVEISNRLKRLFRASDIVGRVGGDEFVVFLEGLGQGYDLQKKLDDIIVAFQKPFEKDGLECSISCSIGAARFPGDGSTFAELFHKADTALYYVKQHGKNAVVIYRAEMS